MTWTKLPPFPDKPHQGCVCCPPVTRQAPLSKAVAVGFGVAQVTKDDFLVFEERQDPNNFHQLQEFEDQALKDPDHDWRLELLGPLHNETYQRQGEGTWVLVESGPGFA